MTPERWQRVKELLGKALEHDPGERSAFLDEACGSDPALRVELESLIAEELLAGDFMKDPQVSPRELTGKTILQYEVMEKLGEGGMGVVYKARDTRLGRFVALKILPPEMMANADRRRRLAREAKAASALNHPNIITVHDIVRENGFEFIVMEYVQGSDLRQILRSGPELSLIRKVKIMSQVADGLIHAHRHGIVHRDVKPANVMVLADGTTKILDFGVACALDSDSTGHTLIGALVGTLQWISPEQLRGHDADALCDIWACGVTFYELLAGRHPFEASDSVNLMYKITSVEPDPLRSVAPECPEALEKIVMRALAKDRERRYQDLEDLRLDMEPLLLELQRRQESLATLSRGKVALWAGTGVLGLALAIGGWWIYHSWNSPAKPEPAVNAPPVAQSVIALPASPVPVLHKSMERQPGQEKDSPTPADHGTDVSGLPRPSHPTTTGDKWKNPKDGLIYVWIPSGSFIMGCSPGDTECLSDEKPAHPTAITSGFWMGQTLVTQDAYWRVTAGSGSDPDPSRFKGANLPVEHMDWNEAKRYCQVVGMRLPTVVEWEYAARAGSEDARYGSLDAIAWYGGNSGGTTHPVGEKQPNAWGLYDMLGNVWQWTASSLMNKYSGSREIDPPGPASGDYRAVRGGSWFVPPDAVRVTSHLKGVPNYRVNFIGFRCVGN